MTGLPDSRLFPWRAGNRCELLVDGECFFPRLLAAIAAARQQVALELYLVEPGSCWAALEAALCQAARRGVRVRCLFDGFGSLALGGLPAQRLSEAGVELQRYNPLRWRAGWRNLHRDHRKLLVVDRQCAFIGGSGATDAFWHPPSATSPWHEVMVQVQGPLAADCQQLFERCWSACQAGALPWRQSQRQRAGSLPPRPLLGLGMARLAFADARRQRDIVQSLLGQLARARQRIWLATPYFLPSRKVRRALRQAARRGVEVRLLLTGRLTDHPPVRYAGQRYYPQLLRAGVRIFEYQPRFLHLKQVLVDDWVSVGSCNFDHWNLYWNLEANLESLDPGLAQAVADCFVEDFRHSLEIDQASWRARPLLVRLRQRLWGWLDRLLVNLLDRRR